MELEHFKSKYTDKMNEIEMGMKSDEAPIFSLRTQISIDRGKNMSVE